MVRPALGILAGCAFAGAAVLGFVSFGRSGAQGDQAPATGVGTDPGGVHASHKLKPKPGDELAAFSGGCFWGVEEFFRHVKGVVATAVGYTGGTTPHPTYDEVCSHTTGHAETVLLEFDPKVVTYDRLLQTYWNYVDPTTLDRQGPDVGNSYRSAIWTFGASQNAAAEASLKADQKLETAPIVTEIKPIGVFWLAETYHQQYDEKTGTNTCPPPRRAG